MKHGIQDKSTTATSIATVIVMRSCLEVSAALLCADSDAGSSNEAVAAVAAVIEAEFMLEEVGACGVLIGPILTSDRADRIITDAYAIDITIDITHRYTISTL